MASTQRDHEDPDNDANANAVKKEDEPVVAVNNNMRPCFANIQSRRLWTRVAPNEHTSALCPSMDLMLLGWQPREAASSSSSSTVRGASPFWMMRTLSWQKVGTVESPLHGPEEGVSTAVCWRPDGRLMAVADSNQTVSLIYTEGLLQQTKKDENQDATVVGSFCVPQTSKRQHAHVTGMAWELLGKPHKAWKETATSASGSLAVDDDDDDFGDSTDLWNDWNSDGLHEEEKKSDSHAAAAWQDLLHPEASQGILPTPKTPLSLLGVTTSTGQLHLYLHGHFLMALPLELSVLRNDVSKTMSSNNNTSVNMTMAMDLTHVLCHVKETATNNTNHGSSLQLYSLPAICQDAPALQTVSAIYSACRAHLGRMRGRLPKLAAALAACLKPLDLKMHGLEKLLASYGLVGMEEDDTKTESDNPAVGTTTKSVNDLVVQYLLAGHAKASPTLANAMDQFFTSMPLNDQLVGRMAGSLTVGLAHVEASIRQDLVTPATALVVHANRLHGWARHKPHLIPPLHTRACLAACRDFFTLAETVLEQAMETRLVLRDWIAWLRSTAAQIKARGASASRREQAQQRRCSPEATRTVLQRLQRPESKSATTQASSHNDSKRGWTETHLRLDLGRLLSSESSADSLPTALTRVESCMDPVFATIQTTLTSSIRRTVLSLSTSSSNATTTAMTMRYGAGGLEDNATTSGYYCPNSVAAAAEGRSVRQWALTAQVVSATQLELTAWPLTWGHAEKAGLALNKVWRTRFEFEWTLQPLQILECHFYGDNGKSSWTAGMDGGDGTERSSREPSLVCLIRVTRQTGETELQVWRLAYETCSLTPLGLSTNDRGTVQIASAPEPCVTIVRPQPAAAASSMEKGENHDDSITPPPTTVFYAQTRWVRDQEHNGSAKLLVSGPRGMAAIVTADGSSGPAIDLLDLEDNEEEEEDDEDDDMEEE